ncbi:helix-turn-helix domain-containing protein [Gordonia terrae]|uniref:helix-turn-helix domain-containing protein n=1 Tax=Gordonia terrae TaxID=2055 RepID=UPI00200AA621|nr:helix-turn-helix domain-containing protein [Gordonia terrae]UPW09798.1 helix-turn-helix domain-containing protein [Gordonia terrae]
MTLETLYSVTQVMEYLGVTKRTVYNYINSGELRSLRVGGHRRIPESALKDFVQGGDAA